MVKLLFGQEPYLIEAKLRKELAAISSDGISEAEEVHFTRELDIDGLEDALSVGFMGNRFLIFKEKDLKNPLLKRLFAVNNGNEIRVIVENVDKRTTLYKSLKPEQIIECNYLDKTMFNRFVLTQIGQEGVKTTEATYSYLIDRIQYGVREGCNLYMVKTWLHLIACAGDVITTETIDRIIPETVEDNAFAIFTMLFDVSAREALFKQLRKQVDKDGGIGILSLLLYSFRLSYKMALVGKENAAKEIGVEPYRIRPLAIETARKAMLLLQGGVNRIKQGEKDWPVSVETVSKILSFL